VAPADDTAAPNRVRGQIPSSTSRWTKSRSRAPKDYSAVLGQGPTPLLAVLCVRRALVPHHHGVGEALSGVAFGFAECAAHRVTIPRGNRRAARRNRRHTAAEAATQRAEERIRAPRAWTWTRKRARNFPS